MPAGRFPKVIDRSILFAHVAYSFEKPFAARNTGIRARQAWSAGELEAMIPEADVVVVSMLWKNHLIARSPRLRLIQSISAGLDQYDRGALRSAGIRLASAHGVNTNAVAEHAMALLGALSRQLHTLRDCQHRKDWRPMFSDASKREEELAGQTVLIVGLGRIGRRIAELCKAFRMKVIATRRDPAAGAGAADEVHAQERLAALLPRADFVVLAAALGPQTMGLIGAREIGLMKPSARLVNIGRGKLVDEPALIKGLLDGRIAGAALDVTREEPLPPASPLWTMPNVIITPHTAGETRAYEDRVIDLLVDNMGRLERGEAALANGVV